MTGEAAVCVACGAGLNPGDRFCRGCGRELSPSELAKTGASPPPAAVPVPPIQRPVATPVPLPSMPAPRPSRTKPGGVSSSLGRGLRGIGRGAAGCLTLLVALGVLGFVLESIGNGGPDTPGVPSSPRATSTVRESARASVPVTPTPEPSPMQVALAAAVADGLVEMLAEGRNLEVLDLTLTSLADEPLEVAIPTGLLFDAKSSGTQSMVVIAPETFRLDPGESLSLPLDVACAAMELDTPGGDDTFSIATASVRLRRLVTSAAFAEADFRIQQFAIWTITDNPTQAGYVGLGTFGVGSGPNDDEIDEIRALFKAAGLDPGNYRALR